MEKCAVILGTAMGPMALGLIHDAAGSYMPMIWVGVAAPLLMVPAIMLLRQPVRASDGGGGEDEEVVGLCHIDVRGLNHEENQTEEGWEA